MTSISTIKTTIRETICQELQIEPQMISDQASLRDMPGIESLKFLRVILCVEEHYNIELEEQVVFSVNTVEALAIAVANQLGNLQPTGGERYV